MVTLSTPPFQSDFEGHFQVGSPGFVACKTERNGSKSSTWAIERVSHSKLTMVWQVRNPQHVSLSCASGWCGGVSFQSYVFPCLLPKAILSWTQWNPGLSWSFFDHVPLSAIVEGWNLSVSLFCRFGRMCLYCKGGIKAINSWYFDHVIWVFVGALIRNGFPGKNRRRNMV